MIKLVSITIFVFIVSSYLNAEEAMTWDDCVKEAKNNNPDLISAQERLKQAKYDKIITESVSWPQISLGLGENYSNSSSFSYSLNG
ncbi:MAG: TolC family protein [Candidatus Firestonebacteria bacterium]